MSPQQKDDQHNMIAARTLAAGLVKTAYMDEAPLEDKFKSEKSLRFYQVPRELHPIDQMEVLARRIFAHYKIDNGGMNK